MEQEPCLGRERHLLGLRVVFVNLSQVFQDPLALLREVLGDVHKLPSSVAQAIGQDALELFGGVARERIAHLDGRRGVGGAAGEQLVKVLTGVTMAGNKQGYGVVPPLPR